jgi:hypothetical protein
MERAEVAVFIQFGSSESIWHSVGSAARAVRWLMVHSAKARILPEQGGDRISNWSREDGRAPSITPHS